MGGNPLAISGHDIRGRKSRLDRGKCERCIHRRIAFRKSRSRAWNSATLARRESGRSPEGCHDRSEPTSTLPSARHRRLGAAARAPCSTCCSVEIDGFTSRRARSARSGSAAVAENRPCGCGHPFGSTAPSGLEVGEARVRRLGTGCTSDRVADDPLRYGIDRPWRVPLFALDAEGVALRRMLAGSDRHRGRDLLPRRARPAPACPSRAVSGARVVVDSSKLRRGTRCCCQRAPRRGRGRVVHLVRDSRGVAYSNQQAACSSTPPQGEPTAAPPVRHP